MAEDMQLMEKRLEERILFVQESILSQFVIISDKLDAVVAAMSHCDITSQPTSSGLLAAVEVIRGSQAPCVTPATLNEKAVASGM